MFLHLQIVKNTYNFGCGAEGYSNYSLKIYKLYFVNGKIGG